MRKRGLFSLFNLKNKDNEILYSKFKVINFQELKGKLIELILDASYNLPKDICQSLKYNYEQENSSLGKSIINKLLINAEIAKNERKPICQDTGTAVFFVEIGNKVIIEGGNLINAIFEATKEAYETGFLRKSIALDPLFDRKNTNSNLPPIIHFEIIEEQKLKISFMPKGGGAENTSILKMLKPYNQEKEIIDLVLNTVINAGGNSCPPIIIGIGIGGNFEYCAYLAKKALLKGIGVRNENKNYAMLEEKIIEIVNNSGLGPQGLGGTVTCLDVHIEYYPCHIASLPVAINIGCNATRHKTIEIF